MDASITSSLTRTAVASLFPRPTLNFSPSVARPSFLLPIRLTFFLFFFFLLPSSYLSLSLLTSFSLPLLLPSSYFSFLSSLPPHITFILFLFLSSYVIFSSSYYLYPIYLFLFSLHPVFIHPLIFIRFSFSFVTSSSRHPPITSIMFLFLSS